jgi:hypothetical protein
MGSAQLWTVPYSMVSDSTKSLLKGSKLSVVSANDGATDALFEVKRKDGQTVFAVYPNAVNIYIPMGIKGTKGGFAIGGFDGSKTTPQDYFRVTRDSVRIYIDQTPKTVKGTTKGGFAIGGFDQSKSAIAVQDLLTVSNDSIRMYINAIPGKGTKGGFAIGGFDQGKGIKNYLNVETALNYVINPSQPRILWYPLKNSFLTGQVYIPYADSVGLNSMASGFESRAIGGWSQALGYKTIARGDYSMAIGKNALAQKSNSFAFGDGAKAYKIDSYAFGAGAFTAGDGSFALGSFGRDTVTFLPNTQPTTAGGDYSFAMGMGAVASGKSSTALGINSSSSGDASMALGVYSKAEGSKSIALCAGDAIGRYSFAAGFYSKSEGDYAVAIGRGISKFGGVYNSASGYGSIALGYSRASGYNSVGIGVADVTSTSGVGLGNSVTVNGEYAVAIGSLLTANSYNSFVIGKNNVVSGSTTAWNATDPLFVVGNGTSAPSNAMTVLKNGNTGIGTTSPGEKLDVSGNIYVNGKIRIGTTLNVAPLNVETWEGTVAMFNRRHNDGTIISLWHGDVDGQTWTEVGTISVSGQIVSYNAFTGSHYAVSDQHIEEGKLVIMNGNNSWFGNTKGSEVLYGISESSVANDPAAMGAYLGILESTKPYGNTNPYLVMATGNGEMWVVDKGENLAPGDFLISSDTKGHAMKDNGKYKESYVIAKVAEPIDWQNVTETIDGIKHYKVSVLFTTFVRNTNSAEESQKVEALNLQVKKQSEEINILKSELEQIKAMLPKEGLK